MSATVQLRKLKMHKKLLVDVIKRQAGTLDKAVLEGVMNSIEAGATDVNITLEEKNEKWYLCIIDNGQGISSEQELDEYFETFGTPHKESENKKWAQFRMGRGQLFAFGKNTWRTSTFQMKVDVDNLGLDYEIKTDQPNYNGCKIEIELYESPFRGWTYNSIESFIETVKKQIRFVKIPVMFNGQQVNINPEDVNWDFEDDNASYIFNVGDTLDVYNLGVYVKSISTSIAGVAGFVCSKKMLVVNFARNDIQYDCPVFAEIQEIIKKNRIKKSQNTALTENERFSLLRDLRDGTQKFYNLLGKNIFKTAQGKWISLKYIKERAVTWTFSDEGSRSADHAMESGICFCLSKRILDVLGYYNQDEKEFFTWLLKSQGYTSDFLDLRDKYISENELAEKFNSKRKIYAENELTIIEKRVLHCLTGCFHWYNRKLCIGKASDARAWTDGKTYIVLDRSWLKQININTYISLYASDKLFGILCHELAHDEDTEQTDIHGPDFYENYYELTQKDNPFLHINSFMEKMKTDAQSKRSRIALEKLEKKQQKLMEKIGG